MTQRWGETPSLFWLEFFTSTFVTSLPWQILVFHKETGERKERKWGGFSPDVW
jgi:hypothetical protein